MEAPAFFFDQLRADYLSKRDLLASGLDELGFGVSVPEGTYFLTTGFDCFGFSDDRKFARYLVEKTGVAVIPLSVFYHDATNASNMIRFAFCKDEATLTEALERLSTI